MKTLLFPFLIQTIFLATDFLTIGGFARGAIEPVTAIVWMTDADEIVVVPA